MRTLEGIEKKLEGLWRLHSKNDCVRSSKGTWIQSSRKAKVHHRRQKKPEGNPEGTSRNMKLRGDPERGGSGQGKLPGTSQADGGNLKGGTLDGRSRKNRGDLEEPGVASHNALSKITSQQKVQSVTPK